MFRFNEGDIADDAAAYLLAVKESVCRNKVLLSSFSSFSLSEYWFCFSRVLMKVVEEKANMAFVSLTRPLESFM